MERTTPIRKSRFTEEQIAYAIRQVEQGTPAVALCRKMGISEQTFYVWKKKYAGVGLTEGLQADSSGPFDVLLAKPGQGPDALAVAAPGARRGGAAVRLPAAARTPPAGGMKVNIKRVHRLYKLEGLGVRTKKRKKRASHLRIVSSPPTKPNERWSMDFVQDSLVDGRVFRALTVLDVLARECLAVHADRSLSGHKAAAALDEVAATRGYPKEITVDNGTEFFSKAMDAWAYRHQVKLDFHPPGQAHGQRRHRKLQRATPGRVPER